MSTQLAPHAVVVTGQVSTQVPCEQNVPAPQGVAQPPQLAPSTMMSTHAAPQAVSPFWHSQTPATQVWPVAQAGTHSS
jgi:hypothetical protein